MSTLKIDAARLLRVGIASLFALLLVLAAATLRAVAADPPVIAAAADLQFALSEIRNLFKSSTKEDVKLSFGSSGNIATQIRAGAPTELFFSADENYVMGLARDGFTDGKGVLYAEGRIVILVPHGSPLKADGSLADLKSAVEQGRVQKFAIANPEHAPYGKRAKEALTHQGIWSTLESKLVLGENVSQAAQFATSGGAQGGIIAYSLALSAEIGRLGTFELIPAKWHEPLRQRMVLTKKAGSVARRFFEFVQGAESRAILKQYGFVLPAE